MALLPFLSKATISMFNPLRGTYSSVSNVPLLVSGNCSPSNKISVTSVLSVTRPVIIALEPSCFAKALIIGFWLSVFIL